MKGRKPVPTALKLVRGNPGQRPINDAEPQPDGSLPECPAHLKGEARAEWNRLALELNRVGLLTSVDRAAMGGYCVAYGRWAFAEEEMAKPGFTLVIETPNGGVMQNPLIGISNKSAELMHKFLVEFGLTPSSRSRLSVGKKDREVDAFESFLKKKA